jgi:hypothetical protein
MKQKSTLKDCSTFGSLAILEAMRHPHAMTNPISGKSTWLMTSISREMLKQTTMKEKMVCTFE